MSDASFMKEALREAGKCDREEDIPVGAVVVLRGKILGRGYNQREKNNDPSGHAEMVAMRSACRKLKTWRLDGASLYTTLEPCPMCAGAMLQSRVKNLFFAMKNIKAGAAGTIINLGQSALFPHKFAIRGGILEEECRLLLENFFVNLRKKRKTETQARRGRIAD